MSTAIHYNGEVNGKLGLPLGGLGASTLEIDHAGRIRNNRLQNKWTSHWGASPKPAPISAFFSVYARANGPGIGKLLQLESASGLPCVQGLKYSGNFPFVNIEYQDDEIPCRVSLEAFSPFIARDADASSLPIIFFCFKLKNPNKNKIQAAVAVSWQNDITILCGKSERMPIGNYNYLPDGKYKSVLMATPEKILKGSEYLLACMPSQDVEYSVVADWWSGKHPRLGSPNFTDKDGNTFDLQTNAQEAVNRWREFLESGLLPGEWPDKDDLGVHSLHCPVAAAAGAVTLTPGEEKEVRFALCWYFPHHHEPTTGYFIGHKYAVRFPNGTQEIVNSVGDQLDDLRRRSRQWQTLIAEATLPEKVKQMTGNIAYLLARCTWWPADDRFMQFESTNCTATNVPPHATASASAICSLFPDQLMLAMRAIAGCQLANGEIPSAMGRAESMHQPLYRKNPAHDVSTYVLACYWAIMWGGGDERFALDIYPSVKKALQWGKSLDFDNDGVPDCHGTDQSWDTYPMFGAAGYVADFWLAALKAGAKLAGYFHDTHFGDWCSKVFEQASAFVESNLWNGAYYDLYYDVKNNTRSNTCLIAQLEGQAVALATDLGYLHPRERVVKAVDSIMTLNSQSFAYGLRTAGSPESGEDSTGGKQSKGSCFGESVRLCALAIRVGKVGKALELLQNNCDFILNKEKEPWRGQLIFDATTGAHTYGEHYTSNLALWEVLYAITGASVNFPEQRLTFAPPVIPVKGPVFTKLFWGQVEFSGNTLILRNAASETAHIKELLVILERKIVFKDISIPPGKVLTLALPNQRSRISS